MSSFRRNIIHKIFIMILFVYFPVVLCYSQPADANEINYDDGLKQVQQFIKAKEFQNAENLLKEMLVYYPDNSELLSILARLLYWEKKYDESIKVYQRLIKVKPSHEAREELDKIFTAKKFEEIEKLIKKRNFMEAEEKLKFLYGSDQSKHGAGYRLGMLYISQREYKKALQIFKELSSLYPDDSGMEALYIESLILTGEIKKARETLFNLPKERKQHLYDSRDDLFYRVRKNYLSISSELLDYTLGIDDEKSYTVQLRQRIAEMTFVASYSTVSRFGLEDNEIGLEIYSRLGEKTKRWGFISVTGSPDAEFLPKWTAGGAVYQGYKNFDFSIGYTHMQFKDASVDIIKPGVIVYLPHRFSLNETLIIDPDKNTATLNSKLYYEPTHKINGFYSYSFGKAAEEIGSLQDVEKIKQYSHRAGIEYRFTPQWSIGSEYQFSHREDSYNKEGFEFFSKYWW